MGVNRVEKKLQKMEITITKAKSATVDCNNVDKKLRQLTDLTEDEANFHMKQSAFLYQLAVQTTPKSLHCLSMRLTVEYFKTSPDDTDQSGSLLNPDLHHYVMFSNNVLASSVVINSTVMNARVCSRIDLFHLFIRGDKMGRLGGLGNVSKWVIFCGSKNWLGRVDLQHFAQIVRIYS